MPQMTARKKHKTVKGSFRETHKITGIAIAKTEYPTTPPPLALEDPKNLSKPTG
jgi:hypothetical protein